MPQLPPLYTNATPFTTRDEIADLLTSQGIDSRIDEAPVSAMQRYISKGTSGVYFYVHEAGTMAQLAATPFVREWATVAAALRLTTFGGEQANAALADEWEEGKLILELIRTKEAVVPGLVLETARSTPCVVNVRVDPQMIPSVRIVRPASSNTPGNVPEPIDYATSLYPFRRAPF